MVFWSVFGKWIKEGQAFKNFCQKVNLNLTVHAWGVRLCGDQPCGCDTKGHK